MNRINLSSIYFPNPSADKALAGADIYIGIIDLDPEVEANQKTVSVLQENGSFVQVSQPIQTGAGGVPLYNGSPVSLYVDGAYSIKVKTSTGSQAYYIPQNNAAESSSTFNTIADMKNIDYSPDDGAVFDILGYNTIGDDAGGWFYWDADSTESDNGITIFKASSITTGRFKRQFNGFGIGDGVVCVKYAGAYGDGTHDDYNALQDAIDYAGTNGCVLVNPGTYKHTQGLEAPYDKFRIWGFNPDQCILNFVPFADGVQLSFGDVGPTYNNCSLEGIRLYSTDSTYTKIALLVQDVDIFTCERVSISGSTVQGGSYFYAGGAGSIGIKTKGRDMHSYKILNIFADRPIVIDKNSNPGTSAGIDADHFHFQDLILGAYGNPKVEVTTGCNLTQITFDGYQAWVLGTHGFYWNDTTSSGTSNGLKLSNIRTEQTSGSTNYSIYINHNYALQNLEISNCNLDPGMNGIYARKVKDLKVSKSYYPGLHEALNADSTVERIKFDDCFWQASSTATLSGHSVVYAAPKYPSTAPLPPNAEYMPSSSSSVALTLGGMLSSTPETLLADGTLEIGIAGTSGYIFLTDGTTGVSAIYAMQWGSTSALEVDDKAGQFSPTKDNAGTINVYYDAGSAKYYVQNKRVTSIVLYYFRIGKYA